VRHCGQIVIRRVKHIKTFNKVQEVIKKDKIKASVKKQIAKKKQIQKVKDAKRALKEITKERIVVEQKPVIVNGEVIKPLVYRISTPGQPGKIITTTETTVVVKVVKEAKEQKKIIEDNKKVIEKVKQAKVNEKIRKRCKNKVRVVAAPLIENGKVVRPAIIRININGRVQMKQLWDLTSVQKIKAIKKEYCNEIKLQEEKKVLKQESEKIQIIKEPVYKIIRAPDEVIKEQVFEEHDEEVIVTEAVYEWETADQTEPGKKPKRVLKKPAVTKTVHVKKPAFKMVKKVIEVAPAVKRVENGVEVIVKPAVTKVIREKKAVFKKKVIPGPIISKELIHPAVVRVTNKQGVKVIETIKNPALIKEVIKKVTEIKRKIKKIKDKKKKNSQKKT